MNSNDRSIFTESDNGYTVTYNLAAEMIITYEFYFLYSQVWICLMRWVDGELEYLNQE